MRVADDIGAKIRSGRSLGFEVDGSGMVQSWPKQYGLYPPPGYLRWDVLQVGNGDTYGYYWPVGKENDEPIVCTTEHDVFRITPMASSLEGCLRIVRVREPEIADEVKEIARDFSVDLRRLRARQESDPEHDLAELDPRSPQLLLEAARDAFRKGEVQRCERNVTLALSLMPEYAEASFTLAQLLHRTHQTEQSVAALLDAITSPLCFGGYVLRDKCLRMLQSLRDDVILTQDNPLWRERKRLTFQTGVKQNDDFRIYEEAIEWYLATGGGVHAVTLRMLVGELLWLETVSFQERYGWSVQKHHDDLRRDIARAGLDARLITLG
jgi:hypothetical protein